MPQLLGTLLSDGTFATPRLPLYDPYRIRQDRGRLRRPEVKELSYANSIYMPGGRWPARAWILLARSDYDQISTYGTYALQIDDFKNGPITLQNLSIVQARCVTRGLAGDANAIYLVELTDPRGVLWNKWFQFPTTSQYNVEAPAYPSQFYTPSMNGASAWTWDQMLGDLWAQMPLLGAYLGLPLTPANTPKNFSFPGTSAWEALNQILSYLGCSVSVDLRSAAPYTITVDGTADAVFDALTLKYAANLEEDLEWIDTGSGRVPKEVIVYFHRINQYYGTEETVRRDGLQWSSQPLYSVTVAGPAAFSQASGTGYLWADFTVRFDVDGNPLAADVATAATIASERVSQYYNRIYQGTVGYLRRVYAGALPFVVGSELDGVRWYEDYSQGRAAWRTEVVRGGEPPWDDVCGMG